MTKILKTGATGTIAIHRFECIGRYRLESAFGAGILVPVSLPNIMDIPTAAALFEIDTNYGRRHEETKETEDTVRFVAELIYAGGTRR